MHIAVGIFTILCTWKWGDWKNWQKYHATMLYIAMSNLLYNVVYYNHWLWQYKPTFLDNHIIADILSSFIILPLSGLILLTNYPDTAKGQLFRMTKFITIYFIFEVVYSLYGVITYNYGWSIWWSLAWDFIMFPMWVLHYKRPLTAYAVSIIVIIIMLARFPVSLN